MALLVWLRREGFGSYATVDEFAGELARRSTSALGALGAALVGAAAEDLAEAAQGERAGVCVDVAWDRRVPRGARVAALRAVLLAGAGAQLGRLYAAACDLIGDERLPQADRQYLARSGLRALLSSAGADEVSVDLLRGAVTAEASDPALVREVVSALPGSHAAAALVRHAALGEPLAPEVEARLVEELARRHRAAQNASPASKRLGTAPEWPPVIPERLRQLIERAERAPAPATPPAQRPTSLRQLRMGEQIELVASRGVRAVERFVAAFDVRAALVGETAALAEVERAARARGAAGVNAAAMDELVAFAASPNTPRAWRLAARAALAHLSPERAATLPGLGEAARAHGPR